MADETPAPPAPPLPKPNAWKSEWKSGRLILFISLVVVTWMLLGLAAWCQYHKPSDPAPSAPAAQAAPQPRTIIDYTESTGGSRRTTGKAEPSTVNLSGATVSGDDLKLTATVMDFDGLGRITGGGFGGSFKVSAGNLRLLVWACVILGLICAVSGTFKWVAKDYVHAIGQWLAAVGFIAGAADPEILGWCLVISTACSMIAHAFPSLAGKIGAQAQAVLGSTMTLLRNTDPAAYNALKSKTPAHDLVIAKAMSKAGA